MRKPFFVTDLRDFARPLAQNLCSSEKELKQYLDEYARREVHSMINAKITDHNAREVVPVLQEYFENNDEIPLDLKLSYGYVTCVRVDGRLFPTFRALIDRRWHHLRNGDLVKLYQELLDAGLLFFDEE